MRTARIKIAAQEGTAVYHGMTRTVNGERVIDDPAGGPAPAALAQLAAFRRRHGTRQRTAPRPLAPIADWGGLVALRGLRRSPFG